jgi:hypothetical protein
MATRLWRLGLLCAREKVKEKAKLGSGYKEKVIRYKEGKDEIGIPMLAFRLTNNSDTIRYLYRSSLLERFSRFNRLAIQVRSVPLSL